MPIWCDFETKSDCDLTVAGVYNYAQDASTEVLCMAYAHDDEEVQVWTPDQPFPGTVINAIKNNGSIPGGYTVNNFLTDPNAWFLLTDVPNGLKHFVRTPLQNSMDGDFDTGNVRYKARERYSFGVSDPLGIFGSPGA